MHSMTQRKAMESVLQRINKGRDGEGAGREGEGASAYPDEAERTESDVMGSIKAAMNSSESAEAKEKKLADMIAELSALKESIAQQKKPKVSISLLTANKRPVLPSS